MCLLSLCPASSTKPGTHWGSEPICRHGPTCPGPAYPVKAGRAMHGIDGVILQLLGVSTVGVMGAL